jgi:tRNA A-37 threonylcarbamoyl transferase component Bud32/tetratricopeptide (TPR) repeat protein
MDALPQDLGDRFVIERELGHGASATVYLARDLKFDGRLVAIKILSPDFALAVRAERFLREIRTTAKLNHPHIVSLFDSGTTQGNQPRPFYVMRFIDGEVLRGIIARGPIPIPEALRVTRQAASALSHAHRHGVIHRDIKPGNIMLEDGHTWVTDFGIARAMASDERSTVTSTGVTIGTPAYMSPEQAMGHADLDGRSDIYSLGCVLYEMLAGRMPFDGPDIQSVMNKHLVEPLPAIREFRPDVPERVEQLLSIALAKQREDRFPSAAEFAEALSLEGAGALTPTRTQPAKLERRARVRGKPRPAVAAWATRLAAVAVVVAVVVLAARMLRRPELNAARVLVTSDWRYGEGVEASMGAERLLQDQLNMWRGISVLGPSDETSARSPGAAARQLGAAWYVRGDVDRVGDSVRVRARLFGAREDSLVRDRSVNLPLSLRGSDSTFARLADQLLFDDSVRSANGGRVGTRVIAARRSFARGLAAAQRWDLSSADSAFRQASDSDAAFAQAHLWLALIRFWGNRPPATWRSSVERAASGATGFSSRDRLLAFGLLHFGRGNFPTACSTWDRLTQELPADFAGWYSLANCLSQDDIVIPDARSPSGWSFRSSYHRAIAAYERAFELLPSIHKALSADSYAAVRDLFKTSADAVRGGRALPPDTTIFGAHASWIGDTLAFVPYTRRGSDVGRNTPLAIRRQRERFHDIAMAWVSATPYSPEAREALAVSLEMLEDPNTLQEMRRARALSSDPAQRIRLAVAEVWLGVKFSVPRDTAGLRTARQLADSLLGASGSSAEFEPLGLASVALLTGRGGVAARLARSRAASDHEGVPAQLSSSALALLAFASLGGPVDSIRDLEEQVSGTINSRMPLPERTEARVSWLVRPCRLAFPSYRFREMAELAGLDYLVAAQWALVRGDTAAVPRLFTDLKTHWRSTDPSNVPPEGVYAEAQLLQETGDASAAIQWLDPWLAALTGAEPGMLSIPANAGSLVRAMSLRADLADRVGDKETAKRWATVVTTLWARGDGFLIPTLARMRRIRES